MAISDEQALAYTKTLNNPTDDDWANWMDSYGVDPTQLSRISGQSYDSVLSRYNAAKSKRSGLIAQPSSGTMLPSNWQTSTQPAQPAYTPPPPPAYTPPPVSAGMSSAEIARLYRQFADNNGGDTEQNRTSAINYLSGYGVTASAINDAYRTYLGSPPVQPAPPPAPAYTPPSSGTMLPSNWQGSGSQTKLSDDQALSYLQKYMPANAADSDFVRVMDTYGISAEQLSRLSSVPVSEIQARYNKAKNTPSGMLATANKTLSSYTPTTAAKVTTSSYTPSASYSPMAANSFSMPSQSQITPYASTFKPTIPETKYAPVLDRKVTTDETIEGRLGNLLSTDQYGSYTNQVVRQAVERAMMAFAGRGLLNTSMAAQAGQEAAISKAIEIAGPDAQTYFQQGRANQDANNVFARDEQGFMYDLNKMGQQQGFDMDKLGAQNYYSMAQNSQQYQYDLQKLAMQQALQREEMALNTALKKDEFAINQAQFDAKLTQGDKQFLTELSSKYDLANLDVASQNAAAKVANDNKVQLMNIESVDKAYQSYVQRLANIDADTNLEPDAKTAMKNAAGKDFDLYAKAKGISWDMQLGTRFSV